jgi:hypothetical protein
LGFNRPQIAYGPVTGALGLPIFQGVFDGPELAQAMRSAFCGASSTRNT